MYNCIYCRLLCNNQLSNLLQYLFQHEYNDSFIHKANSTRRSIYHLLSMNESTFFFSSFFYNMHYLRDNNYSNSEKMLKN